MTKSRGSRDILYNRCSNQDLKTEEDEEEEEKEDMMAGGKAEHDVVGNRRLRYVRTPPPNTSRRCASSTCCLPPSSSSSPSSLLLKIHFALFIILFLSAIPAIYLLRREWQIQREELQLQVIDLNDKLRLYNTELEAFANGEYADFYAEPQTIVDDLPEEETEEESTVVKSRGQRRHVLPSPVTSSRRTVKKRLPPGLPVPQRAKVAASGLSKHAKGKRVVPGSLRRSSVDTANWDAQMLYGATSTAKPTTTQHMTDTEYVWLTSHSRIPLYALKEFCQATRAHCIQDMEAFISSPEVNVRLRGEKGEKGTPGPPGHCSCPQSASTLRRSVPHYTAREGDTNGSNKNTSNALYVQGSRGPPGPRGAKGERGPPGPPGVCAIKCIDEDLLPLRSSSYWASSSSINQQPSAGSSLLVSTTDNPYLAQPSPQDILTISTPDNNASQEPSQTHPPGTQSTTDASPSSGDMQLPEPPRIWQEKDQLTSTSTAPAVSAIQDGDQSSSSSTTISVDDDSLLSATSKSAGYEEVLGPMVNAEDLPTPAPSLRNGMTVPHHHASATPVDPSAGENSPEVTNGNGQPSTGTDQTSPAVKAGLPVRKRSCLIEAIGKPVLLRSPPVAGEQASTTAWGSVMRDAHPSTAEQAAKYYLTEQFTGRQLLEYASLAHFKLFTPTLKYSLPKTFRGVGHLVYNGSFYYHVDTQPLIVKFDLATERITAKKIVEGAAYRHGHYIYNLNKNYDYMDFAADEHGLWLIYTTDHSTNAMVAHLDPQTLDVLFTRNISFSHRHMGNAFVACGIFYGLSTVHFPYSHLVLAYDLLEDRYYQPPKEALFTNPRQKSVMVDYNPHDRKLYSYDDGWPLFFPLKFSHLNTNNL